MEVHKILSIFNFNTMKKFISTLFLFSVLTLIGFKFLDSCISYKLKQISIYERKIDADCILLGSSVVKYGIVPKILDSILNVKSYNLGFDGDLFCTQYARYQLYRKNNKPKVILQVLSYGALMKKSRDNEKAIHWGMLQPMRFAPYLDNPFVCHATKRKNAFKIWDYYVPLTKYTSLLTKKTSIFKEEKNGYKGYFALDKAFNRSKFDKDKKAYPNGIILPLSDKMIHLFEDYLVKNKQENIQTILVFPPIYYEEKIFMKNTTDIMNAYKQIAKKYNIIFLDYSDYFSNGKATNIDYFADTWHLNKKGSENFTKKLSEDLKGIK